ncbi:MAG: flagellar hook-length control protein FliK, partial [Pseudomonadota bacterium]|nr:flagellar hook-length control protein FliK [Pseudomonadota bacterium]
MLTSAKVSQSEPAILGLEPLRKGQPLPQEAKFSELFSSMYSASKEEALVVSQSTTLNEMPKESGEIEAFSIANDLLDASTEGDLPGLVTLQLENGSLNSDLTKTEATAANTDIMTLVENALTTYPVVEEAKLNHAMPAAVDAKLNNAMPVTVDAKLNNIMPVRADAESMIVDIAVSELSTVDALAFTKVAEITNVNSFSINSIESSDVEKHLTENFNIHQVLDKQVSINNVDAVGEVKSEHLVASEETVELAVQQPMAEIPVANQVPVTAQMTNSVAVSNANQIAQNVSSSNSSISQTLTQLGAASSEAQQASSATAQNNQSFSQGNQQQFSGQQQMMQFQAQKSQAIEQQMNVKATDELMVKAESKESLLNGEFSTSDRRMQLPVGLQSIPLPVKSPQWGQALGQRVVFMANNQLQQAQITLNPEKLGPVQVKLHMDKEQQVHVTMTAQHGTT